MADVWRYRVDIAGLPGGPGLSTYHFDPTAGFGTAQELVDAVETWHGVFDAFVHQTIDFNGAAEIEVIDLGSGQQTSTIPVVGWNVGGTNSGTMLPPTTQMLVRWNTTSYINGRRIQGKTYLPGFCEDSNEANGLPQTAVTAAVQAGAQTFADVDDALCVYSRVNGAIAGPITASVWSKWAVQRGRRDG